VGGSAPGDEQAATEDTTTKSEMLREHREALGCRVMSVQRRSEV